MWIQSNYSVLACFLPAHWKICCVTVCRALGIPCRPVTNFSSAHDTHGSLTADYFVNEDGEVMEELVSDFVW